MTGSKRSSGGLLPSRFRFRVYSRNKRELGLPAKTGARSQRDLTKPMMAETAGPSGRKKPWAPRALHGVSLGSHEVLIQCRRALPCDQATNCCAPLGNVNLQTSRL